MYCSFPCFLFISPSKNIKLWYCILIWFGLQFPLPLHILFYICMTTSAGVHVYYFPTHCVMHRHPLLHLILRLLLLQRQWGGCSSCHVCGLTYAWKLSVCNMFSMQFVQSWLHYTVLVDFLECELYFRRPYIFQYEFFLSFFICWGSSFSQHMRDIRQWKNTRNMYGWCLCVQWLRGTEAPLRETPPAWQAMSVTELCVCDDFKNESATHRLTLNNGEIKKPATMRLQWNNINILIHVVWKTWITFFCGYAWKPNYLY